MKSKERKEERKEGERREEGGREGRREGKKVGRKEERKEERKEGRLNCGTRMHTTDKNIKQKNLIHISRESSLFGHNDTAYM
jgi:hypothetical protein